MKLPDKVYQFENYLKAASETCWQPRRLSDLMNPPQCFDNFSMTRPYKVQQWT